MKTLDRHLDVCLCVAREGDRSCPRHGELDEEFARETRSPAGWRIHRIRDAIREAAWELEAAQLHRARRDVGAAAPFDRAARAAVDQALRILPAAARGILGGTP